jgi:hypothetical protein
VGPTREYVSCTGRTPGMAETGRERSVLSRFQYVAAALSLEKRYWSGFSSSPVRLV